MSVTNYTNTSITVLTGKQTVPAAAAATGTIITEGTAVVGTGTKFLSEMRAGSWIYSSAQSEVRKVIRVDSDLIAYIDKAFDTDLTSAAPVVIPEVDTHIVSVILTVVSGSPKINNVAYASVYPITLTKEGRSTSSTRDFIDPLVIDATGASLNVITLR